MSMESGAPVSKTAAIVGWVMGILPAGLLVMSAVMKFVQPEGFAEGLAKMEIPQGIVPGLAIVELACVVFYLIPQTAVIGAILCTGYMGGAIITHLRIGEAFYMQVGIGILFWGGLFLRDRRIRALIPLRRKG